MRAFRRRLHIKAFNGGRPPPGHAGKLTSLPRPPDWIDEEGPRVN